MPLYSDEELKQFREFENLDEALQNPEAVIRLSVYRHQNAAALARIVDLRNLQSLSISLADVSRLLPKLGKLMNLQNLYLQACNISSFPGSILELRNLRSLSIGNNSLRELPDEIYCLVKLDQLRFLQNQLRRIPESMGRLTQLKTLCLSYNELEALPDSIGNLLHLEWLILDANQLRHVPDAIGNLSCLQGLTLNHNRLSTLPDSICKLRRLETLSIEHNPFDSLPKCLSSMASTKVSMDAGKRSLFMDWTYQHSSKPPQSELAELRLFVDSGSELYKSLMATIQKCMLSKVRSVILRVAREAIEIRTTGPDDYSLLGRSRFGGFPDLANPLLFPRTDNLYWSFLAQINLADVAPLNGYLPRSGLLSFFIESTQKFNAKVLFYQGSPRKLITIRHGGTNEMVDPQDDYTQRPCRIKFGRFFSLPYDPPDGIQSERDREAYEECEVLHKSIEHHINGYTFTQHESPQQQAANKLGGLPNEWVSLLQLGSDQKVGFCFWDAGTLTFSIHQEDLRRWDFSKIHVSLETS